MIIRWEDRDWSFDVADLTNRQAQVIEAASGKTLGDWFDLLEAEDALDAAKPHFVSLLTVFYWLMLDQNGVKVKIADVEFPMLRFGVAVATAMAAQVTPAQANGSEPDPTTPSPAASAPSPAPSSRSKRKTVTIPGSPDG